jgi:hypothetical protein
MDPVIYIILIVVVLVFGLGVVVLGRRRSTPELAPPAQPVELLPDRTSEMVRPPRPVDVDEQADQAEVEQSESQQADVGQEEGLDVDATEPVELERPSFR